MGGCWAAVLLAMLGHPAPFIQMQSSSLARQSRRVLAACAVIIMVAAKETASKGFNILSNKSPYLFDHNTMSLTITLGVHVFVLTLALALLSF
jgi:hypothetical protein